jgi:hypothetical protein
MIPILLREANLTATLKSAVPSLFRRGRGAKLLCAFLLVFQTFFLNVVIPGHTRGVITLSGKNGVCSAADLGCPFCQHSDDHKKSPTSKDQSDCAICHLALRITTNPPIDFHLDDLGLLKLAAIPPRNAPIVATIVLLHFSRGPPVITV